MKQLLVACLAVFGLISTEAEAQSKFFRIAYIAAAAGPSPFFDAFRQGLADLGYVEWRNIAIEYRSSRPSSSS